MKKVLGFVLALWASMAQGATLLPNGQQQFIDGNGKPYAGGKVWFYSNFPTCTVLKNTWSDSAGTVLNTNPITLDAAGRATIFGTGEYCQVLKDSLGNTIWTKYTSDTSSASNLGWGGTSGGTANAQTLTVTGFSGVNGQTLYFLAGNTNTGSMTLAINGIVYPVVKDVAAGPVFLTGGEVVTGNVIGVTYDSASGRLHLVTNNVSQFGTIATIPATSGTIALNSAPSHVVNASGTAGGGVTSFGPDGANAKANTIFFVTFDSSNVITYNATSLITPSAGNMQVQAGDSIVVTYLGSGNWKILGIMPASNASGGLNVQTGTTYTVLAGDAGKIITMSNAAAIAVTLPQATGSFGLGYKTTVQNAGSTLVTVTPTTSTVNGTTALVIGPKEAATFISNGTNWIATTNNPLEISQTIVATTTGNTITASGIPPWAKEVKVHFSNVGWSTITTFLRVRVGPVAGVVSTGYTGMTFSANTGSVDGLKGSSDGFTFEGMNVGAGAQPIYGVLTLTLADPATNTWAVTGIFGQYTPPTYATGLNHIFVMQGQIALAGPLYQILLTTTIPGDAFNSGFIELTYR